MEDKSSDALTGYIVSIDELEEKTGIDFFCNLPDDKEESLESTKAADIISAWFQCRFQLGFLLYLPCSFFRRFDV